MSITRYFYRRNNSDYKKRFSERVYDVIIHWQTCTDNYYNKNSILKNDVF